MPVKNGNRFHTGILDLVICEEAVSCAITDQVAKAWRVRTHINVSEFWPIVIKNAVLKEKDKNSFFYMTIKFVSLMVKINPWQETVNS